MNKIIQLNLSDRILLINLRNLEKIEKFNRPENSVLIQIYYLNGKYDTYEMTFIEWIRLLDSLRTSS